MQATAATLAVAEVGVALSRCGMPWRAHGRTLFAQAEEVAQGTTSAAKTGTRVRQVGMALAAGRLTKRRQRRCILRDLRRGAVVGAMCLAGSAIGEAEAQMGEISAEEMHCATLPLALQMVMWRIFLEAAVVFLGVAAAEIIGAAAALLSLQISPALQGTKPPLGRHTSRPARHLHSGFLALPPRRTTDVL